MVITELKSNVSQLVLSVPSLNPVVVSTQRFVASSPSLRMRFTSQWPFGLYIRTKVRDVGRRKKREEKIVPQPRDHVRRWKMTQYG